MIPQDTIPVEVAQPPALSLETAKEQFAFLWLCYLGHWGPKFGVRGRRHHHWRIHQILDLMEEVQVGHEGHDWDVWLASLPGFSRYWNNEASYDAHHDE
jgi:hypothetical protein